MGSDGIEHGHTIVLFQLEVIVQNLKSLHTLAWVPTPLAEERWKASIPWHPCDLKP
jgi:hypothetical protein